MSQNRIKSNALATPIPRGGVYLERGKEVMRLYAVRPAAVTGRELFKPGHFKTSLQPVVCGQVQAWAPVWEEWLTAEGVAARLVELQAEGWKIRKNKGGK